MGEKQETARRPTGAGEYDRIAKYLEALKAEHTHAWPLSGERLLEYIGPDAWVTIVNYERVEKGQEALDAGAALGVRAKLFD